MSLFFLPAIRFVIEIEGVCLPQLAFSDYIPLARSSLVLISLYFF